MAKTPPKPTHNNTQSADNSAGTAGTAGQPLVKNGNDGGTGPVPPTFGYSIGASKIIEDSRSSRVLEALTGVGHSVIHRIRREPGYQPSEPNQTKLVAAKLVLPNEFRRWPEDEPEEDEPEGDTADTGDTDLQLVYGLKVRRSQLRTRLRRAENQLNERELLLGSAKYADFYDRLSESVEHFTHPDAPDPEDHVGDAIVRKHLDSRGPDCWVGKPIDFEQDGTLPECCARYHAEMEAYEGSAERKAWSDNYWAALRAHVESVYGRKCDDRELGETNFALELVRSLLPTPHCDGPMAQCSALASEFKSLIGELEQHIGAIPQRTRVHLQAAQLLESLTAEHQQLSKVAAIDLKKSRPWNEIMKRTADGLAKHEALRNHIVKTYRNRYVLQYDLLATFEYDDLPSSTRARYSQDEKQKRIDRRREELLSGESVWQ